MPNQPLPYSETRYFSGLICDYLAKEDRTLPFYHRFPSIENFEPQMKEKSAIFSAESRRILVEQLKKQYQDYEISALTLSHIESLQKENTFTITTGHQLNLFTGPLYFLYKIFSVINLAEELQQKYESYQFVPVYWMATEDHDFDEINYFNFKGKKVGWNRKQGGAVGELSMEGLEKVFTILQKEWGYGQTAKRLLDLFSEAYLKHTNLADATRYLGNALFQEYGLVIVDGNDPILKKAFIPYVKTELFEGKSFAEISRTTDKLKDAGYAEQVFPREINLFYLKEGLRERIIEKEGIYYVNETDLVFSKEEIIKEMESFPERFSPNALLRPLYQEVILPNLCYIGGGGELAYWFQLKDYFISVKIPFPILLLRNSVLLLPKKLEEKLKKLDVKVNRLFQKQQDLTSEYTRQLSQIAIDFSKQRAFLKDQFKDLYGLAEKTDPSFIGAVSAQEKKQLNGLDYLEKRLLRAQKRNLKDHVDRLTLIQDELFPNESLQERIHNFSEWYLELGPSLLSLLKTELHPLSLEFTILEV
jgi:bacillithiol synthase